MKTVATHPTLSVGCCAKRNEGLTLVEMMITMGIFSLMIMALVYAHIFGLKQDELVESKLGASDEARKGFELIARDIRSAKIWQVGNMVSGTFTNIPNGTLQRGNAIQVALTNNAYAVNICYYFTNLSGDYRLCRFHTGDGNSTVIASNLFNTNLFFTAEDYSGSNVYNDIVWHYVVHFTLQFQQYQYPKTQIGSGSNFLYNYYAIDFRFTPHAPH